MRCCVCHGPKSFTTPYFFLKNSIIITTFKKHFVKFSLSLSLAKKEKEKEKKGWIIITIKWSFEGRGWFQFSLIIETHKRERKKEKKKQKKHEENDCYRSGFSNNQLLWNNRGEIRRFRSPIQRRWPSSSLRQQGWPLSQPQVRHFIISLPLSPF